MGHKILIFRSFSEIPSPYFSNLSATDEEAQKMRAEQEQPINLLYLWKLS